MARLRIVVMLFTLGIILSCVIGCGKKAQDNGGTTVTPPVRGTTSAPAADPGTTAAPAPDAAPTATPPDPGAADGDQYTPPPTAEGDPPLEEPAVPRASTGNRPRTGGDDSPHPDGE